MAGAVGLSGDIGPQYGAHIAKAISTCKSDLVAAVSAAASIALTVIQNASRYSAVLAKAASQLMSNWQGSQTPMAITAAVEFLVLCASTLGPAEFLALLVVGSATVAGVFLAINCLVTNAAVAP